MSHLRSNIDRHPPHLLLLLLLHVLLLVVTVISAPSADKEGFIQANLKYKFIFVGGKGGVGKTTVSSAFAIQMAHEIHKNGGKVLLISTDPAHSLSDAFRTEFGGEPKPVPELDGALEVMEIDPNLLLQKELEQLSKITEEAGFDLAKEVTQIQQWLASIPGIDEATALASVVDYITSGRYTLVVFDTAPTGHTLKLLQLPDVLQTGLEKLQGWQSQLWTYYDTFKGLMSFGSPNAKKKDSSKLKRRLENKLQKYKEGIEKVAVMLKDNSITNFITVCIAEYLSISESQRLLSELQHQKIHTSHIVVNQLIQQTLSDTELKLVEEKMVSTELTKEEREKVTGALGLLVARQKIQEKYLETLRNFEEVEPLGVIEVPLLPIEVTGVERLKDFSKYLLETKKKNREEEEEKRVDL